MVLRSLFLLVSFLLFTLNSAEAAEPTRHTTARIFAAVQGVGKERTLPIGIALHMDEGWKAYWRTPGEAGLAPVFDWAGSSNVKNTQIQWPAPTRFTAFDIDNFGYENNVVFPVNITLAKPGKALSLKLKLDLLVCNNICIPEMHQLTLNIPAGEAKVTDAYKAMNAAQKTLPVTTASSALTIENAWLEDGENDSVDLHIFGKAKNKPGRKADMFVEASPFISVGKPVISYDSTTEQLHLQAPVRSKENFESVNQTYLHKEVTITYVDGDQAYERKVLIGGKASKPLMKNLINITKDHIDLTILLLAFLGGLILNLMPCVLPVLSLKILSILSHGGKDHRIHRWTIFKNFMASAAGIIASFWVMAASLAVLKAGGSSIGWGIQFQHPGFLLFLIAVLMAFAANLWGLYEVSLPRAIATHLPAKHEHEPTLLGHFLTGAFATLLATPCTAPFLGTAISFALAGDVADIFIIFTFLGFGLAFPYFLLAISPRIFKYMPKPGKWMITVKKFMALALVLTAVWLMNVLLTIATQPTLDDGWTRFDAALIKPAVEDGKTVIVDVTADWCLTCKANKRLVLNQQDVRDAISGPNILRLQADWTHRDEAIAAYLRSYGRYGVPFNIVYGPGAPNGIILNELLSKEEIMSALAEAADE